MNNFAIPETLENTSFVLRRFLEWWGNQLREILPAWLKTIFKSRCEVLSIQDKGETYKVINTKERTSCSRKWIESKNVQQETIVNKWEYDPVFLTVDSGRAFITDLTISVPNESEISNAVRMQAARYLPMNLNQLYWTYKKTKSSSTGGIHIQLIALKKSAIDPMLQHLINHGYSVRGVDVKNDGVDYSFSLRLRPFLDRVYEIFRTPIWLGIFYLVLLGSIVIWRINLETENLIEEISLIEIPVQEIIAERENIQARVSDLAPIIDSLRQPGALELTEALSRLFPENTWVQSLGMRGGMVTIRGTSSDPSQLVAALSSEPLFQEIELGSISQVSGRADLQSFVITLHMVAEGAPL